MASSVEYRRYMDECLRAAAKARLDEERRSLLQLAHTWHEAINVEAKRRAGETERAPRRLRDRWRRYRPVPP
jgi:hypothetical protein